MFDPVLIRFLQTIPRRRVGLTFEDTAQLLDHLMFRYMVHRAAQNVLDADINIVISNYWLPTLC